MSSFWHNRPYVPRAAPGKCGCSGSKAPVTLTEAQKSSLQATTVNSMPPPLSTMLSGSANNIQSRFFPNFSQSQFVQTQPSFQSQSVPSLDLSGAQVNSNFKFNRFPMPQKKIEQIPAPIETPSWTQPVINVPLAVPQPQAVPPVVQSHSNTIFNSHGFPVGNQYNFNDLYRKVAAVEYYQDKTNRSTLLGCTSCSRR